MPHLGKMARSRNSFACQLLLLLLQLFHLPLSGISPYSARTHHLYHPSIHSTDTRASRASPSLALFTHSRQEKLTLTHYQTCRVNTSTHSVIRGRNVPRQRHCARTRQTRSKCSFFVVRTTTQSKDKHIKAKQTKANRTKARTRQNKSHNNIMTITAFFHACSFVRRLFVRRRWAA